jgi:Ni/Fe-hydrogenase subunit HybB-like protein
MSAHGYMRPVPIQAKFLTPGVMVLLLIAAAGLAVLAARFIFGLRAVTNLSDGYPWGLWIGIDVATGVALAAGGFTSAAIAHMIRPEAYESVTRPALLTAVLGYTFVSLALFVDIGRSWAIWHPVFYHQGTRSFSKWPCVWSFTCMSYTLSSSRFSQSGSKEASTCQGPSAFSMA